MKIMIVENEPLLCETMIEALEFTNLEVASALSASEALAISASYRRFLNLVVTDIDLGVGLNGFDLTKKLRKRVPLLNVIYISGDWNNFTSRGLRPNEWYLYKPFSVWQLVATVRESLSVSDSRMTVPCHQSLFIKSASQISP